MAVIQFIKGINETVIADVSLTRSKDGSTGTATFRFNNPDILKSVMQEKGDITGMYLKDDEGELVTRDVSAKFVNGKPQAITSIYIIKSPQEWDRFMRFMERYANKNQLSFTKAK
uniref:Photosystem II reaction center Psb28 protein n=2 Tax=Gracilariopsis TaxID=2781 RepID=A0A1C9CF70_9FLOR|nr:photosystem II protein W [Gracilariopsis lemaneiformis]YP_009294757.1 photosystem II protein W [Gracilariopsis chorda]AJO68398.1 photosystem II protein W [Gracilariopsis lemaneiformis]AML79868.1 photosystem II protein W [Gracilariopsis lemaneiformis]AOM67017.1 photosystem II protein W [Gracilariopsis chorda]UAD88925.1 photosystem II protein psb28 [Gracilariopsis chorda]